MDDKNVSSGREASQSSPAPKEAPPESSNTLWTRRSIIFCFWLVAITLGVPYWIWTTSIHRAELPLQLMDDWANGNTCQLRYPLNINIVSLQLDTIQMRLLNSRVEQKIANLSDFQLLNFHLNGPEEPILTVQLEQDSKADTPQAVLSTGRAELRIQHSTVENPAKFDSIATLISSEVQRLFEDEEATLSHLLAGTSYDKGYEARLSPAKRTTLDARNTRAFKYAPNYHITFSLFAGSATPSSWDIEQALDQYITPLVKPLSSISNITINTQVQLHASFSPSVQGPTYDESTKQWKLHHTDLGGFINAAEWPLSPSIGFGPTINFVLFVPSERQRPLLIAETSGTSWLIPQWGGVQILNPTKSTTTTHLSTDDLRPAMLTFADQLTSLLGLPPSPPSISLRISRLERSRATSLILSASSTLGALSRLTLKLTSIAIPDSVSNSVDETLSRLDLACQNLRKGEFDKALENARIAETEVEKAFFEPSMVGQVYFPDEHKVAVYVPLLGPMAVPLVMAGLHELKSWRRTKVKTN